MSAILRAFVLVIATFFIAPTGFGQDVLLRLKVSQPLIKEWYFGKPGPQEDKGQFKIPAAGVARFTYAGSPKVDEQQLSCLQTDHWLVNQTKIPGGDVVPWTREEKDGNFKYVWVKKFLEEDIGREIKVKLGVRITNQGAVSAHIPAQGSIFVVEWLGSNSIPPNTIDYEQESNKTGAFQGTWTDSKRGDSWAITQLPDGTYDVKSTILNGVTGKGVVNQGSLKIEFTSASGIRGTFDIKLDPSGKTATGIVRTDEPAQFASTISLGSSIPPIPEAVGFTVKATNYQIKSGQTINVPVELLDADGVSNLNVVVEYSADVVRVNAAPIAGNVRTDHLFQANAKEPGIVRIGLAGKSSVQANGQLVLIPFTAVGQVGSKTAVKLEVTTANNGEGATVPAKTISGLIEIVADSPPPPPVVLTPKDAMEALMMSVKLRTEDLKLDLDKDGKVTSNDARMILKEVVAR